MNKERYLGTELEFMFMFGEFADVAKEYINNRLDECGTCSLDEVKNYIYENYVIAMREWGIKFKDENKVKPNYSNTLYGWIDRKCEED